jgi:hypothetical protein
MEQDNHVLSVYNPEKQELIGIFKGSTICAMYLFGDSTKSLLSKVYKTAMRNGKTFSDKLNMKVAVRIAKIDQKERLETKDFLIENGYPAAVIRKKNQFVNT